MMTKKAYMKPALRSELMELQPVTIRTCSDAADWWDPMPLQYGTIFIPEYMADCEMTEKEYMEVYGGRDGGCYYASTDDGQTFTS